MATKKVLKHAVKKAAGKTAEKKTYIVICYSSDRATVCETLLALDDAVYSAWEDGDDPGDTLVFEVAKKLVVRPAFKVEEE